MGGNTACGRVQDPHGPTVLESVSPLPLYRTVTVTMLIVNRVHNFMLCIQLLQNTDLFATGGDEDSESDEGECTKLGQQPSSPPPVTQTKRKKKTTAAPRKVGDSIGERVCVSCALFTAK